ncbi:MAG TPA: DUF2189 domain-containing protein [Acetobacteraceae bacterium]|nr:DUF2189 domain-containing protein [Acetobacteraceae bacterium]
MAIRNPIEWGVDQLRLGAGAVGAVGHDVRHAQEEVLGPPPRIARIGIADLREALARGLDDFKSNRTDVIFLCVAYPVLGLILGNMASGMATLPLLFPLAAGFALVGPLAAVGLYEISRRREQGLEVSWADAFGVLRSHALGSIIMVGLVLLALFGLWLMAAKGIYTLTLGPEQPHSLVGFVRDVVGTSRGWALIVIGMGVGFLFAVVALAIGVVSFPLLLDREVGFETALWTSVRAVAANPGTMALWGLIVAAGLLLGSIPLFLGLVIVLPVLGHGTWHLYRRVVQR